MLLLLLPILCPRSCFCSAAAAGPRELTVRVGWWPLACAAVSMSSGREMAAKRRRAEELGRHGVNEQQKARNRRQNDQMVEQARKRAAAAPPAPAPLSEEVLKHMEAAEAKQASAKPAPDHPERWVLGMNPRGDDGGSDDEEDGEGHFPADEDAEEGDEMGFGKTIGGGPKGRHVVWSSDSDDEGGGGSDDEDSDDEGGVGVQPVVLQDRHTQANKPKVEDFRKQHLYGGRLNRQNGLLALARRTKGRLGPSSRF